MGETIRARAERNLLPVTGARFFRDGEVVSFEFVIDPSNVIGPRPATSIDQTKHPEAWATFIAAEGVSTLDRDAEGLPGGGLPQESAAKRVPVQRTRKGR